MANAKVDFIERIRTLNKSISETEAVRSKGPSEREHNEVARMLRNGLAVVGFASLEDFIKARSSEVLDSIGPIGISFDKLPEKVQIATTSGAVSALMYQLGLRDKQDKIAFVQEQAQKISSTTNSGYELTSLAFGFGQSNLNAETVKSILSNFNIEDPWAQITNIASSLGLAALPLQVSFINATSRRHRAAQVAGADTPQGDILQFVNEAIAIAVGFDFLLSKALKMIETLDPSYLNGTTKVIAKDINYRVVRHSDNKWKEHLKEKAKAFRTSIDLASLSNEAKRRAIIRRQFYIQFDKNGLIEEWVC